jgi:hypothetical protein
MHHAAGGSFHTQLIDQLMHKLHACRAQTYRLGALLLGASMH